MSVRSPGPACEDLLFPAAYPVGEAGEVALEDYARALTRAEAAEVLAAEGEPPRVRGVHVCRPQAPVTPALRADLDAFARGLAVEAGGGLGWS